MDYKIISDGCCDLEKEIIELLKSQMIRVADFCHMKLCVMIS